MNEIIRELSNDEYHDRNGKYGDYISSSLLKLYAKSPATYKYALDHPQEETDAMRFGSLFHDLMASLATHNADPGKSMKAWSENLALFIPPLNPKGKPFGVTSNAYKEAYEAFLQASEGKTIISEPDYELVTSMALSLLYYCGSTSEQVRKLLKWGKPEVSIFHETEDGIKIKIRPDLLTSGKIVDWKSVNTDDLSEESLNRIILRYGYHISTAQYQWVAKQALGKWLDFYEVFVSKVPPYDAVMVKMNAIKIDDYGEKHYGYGYCYDRESDIVIPGCGALEFKRLLDLHTRCTKENHWPGAETFIPGDKYRIMEIEPPRWYNQKFMDEI